MTERFPNIEFRGVSIDTNTLVYGEFVQQDGYIFIHNNKVLTKVVPETVGIFTTIKTLSDEKLYTGMTVQFEVLPQKDNQEIISKGRVMWDTFLQTFVILFELAGERRKQELKLSYKNRNFKIME